MTPETASAEAPPVQKVLLVDDKAENRLALRATLESLPCELLEASSGEEALRHLLVHDVALLVLDVQMPGLDGYQTARHIREREKTRSVPLIFVSGIDRDLEHQLRGYSNGAVDFLTKPFEPATLVGKVRTLLELDDTRRRLIARERQLTARVKVLAERLERVEASAAAVSRENVMLRRLAEQASRDLVEPAELTSAYLDLLTAELAGEDAPGSERARLLLAHASAAAGRVAAEATRRATETGRYVRTEGIAVDLNEVLAAARAALGERADGVRMTADPLPVVEGDAFLLELVVIELLSHAIAVAGRAPRLHVGASRRGSQALITIYGDGTPEHGGARLSPTWPGLEFCRSVLRRLDGALSLGEAFEGAVDVCISLPLRGDDAWAGASPDEASADGE